MGREHRRHMGGEKKLKKKKKKRPKLVLFSDDDVILREAAVARPAAHLSSFLDTLDECHAVDLPEKQQQVRQNVMTSQRS